MRCTLIVWDIQSCIIKSIKRLLNDFRGPDLRGNLGYLEAVFRCFFYYRRGIKSREMKFFYDYKIIWKGWKISLEGLDDLEAISSHSKELEAVSESYFDKLDVWTIWSFKRIRGCAWSLLQSVVYKNQVSFWTELPNISREYPTSV